jgi:CRP/FNR family nitrogen fixation transcriptional regulator
MAMNPASANPQFGNPVWGHERIESPRSIPQALDSIAAPSRYEHDQVIYREESPVAYWYRLISGAAQRFAVRPDGKRQIVDLLLPGDMFGFGIRGEHSFSAEAITDGTVVARYPIARVEALAASGQKAAQEIRELVIEAAARLHSLLLILGRTTAEEKVGCFLLLMQRRVGCGPGNRLVLPLTRYDVADYLALSVETVSRALSGLKKRGVIALSGPRQIGIIDSDALLDRRDNVETLPMSPRVERRPPQLPADVRRPSQLRAEVPQAKVVEIRIPSFAFADTLSDMRSWLDHHRCDPSRFTCVREGSGAVVVRVEFESNREELVRAFTQEFARSSVATADASL